MAKTNNNAAQAPATAAPTPTPDKQGGQSASPGGKGPHRVTNQAPSKNNVIALPGMCIAQECKQKSQKANFCMEHFDWFKEGLITKEGHKPTDFAKKFYDFNRRRMKKKAA
jgi:hypothetical protein